jgi:hypothetical protein
MEDALIVGIQIGRAKVSDPNQVKEMVKSCADAILLLNNVIDA